MFTRAQHSALTAQQQQAIQQAVYALNEMDDAYEITAETTDDDFNEFLGLLGVTDGCVPSEYVDEDLDQRIIRKLKGLYGAGRDLAVQALEAQGHDFSGIRWPFCYVEPSCDDSSHVVIHDEDHVYFNDDRNAWRVGFDSLEELAAEVLAIRDRVVSRYKAFHPGTAPAEAFVLVSGRGDELRSVLLHRLDHAPLDIAHLQGLAWHEHQQELRPVGTMWVVDTAEAQAKLRELNAQEQLAEEGP